MEPEIYSSEPKIYSSNFNWDWQGGVGPGLLGLVLDSWAALRHWLGGSRPRLGPHPLLRVLPCRGLAPPTRTAALVAA